MLSYPVAFVVLRDLSLLTGSVQLFQVTWRSEVYTIWVCSYYNVIFFLTLFLKYRRNPSQIKIEGQNSLCKWLNRVQTFWATHSASVRINLLSMFKTSRLVFVSRCKQVILLEKHTLCGAALGVQPIEVFFYLLKCFKWNEWKGRLLVIGERVTQLRNETFVKNLFLERTNCRLVLLYWFQTTPLPV